MKSFWMGEFHVGYSEFYPFCFCLFCVHMSAFCFEICLGYIFLGMSEQ